VGLIGPELAAFLQGGRAIMVGTAGADGRPDATRGWGLVVGADGESVRVRIAAGATAFRNLEANDRVAVLCCDVQTYQTIQLKGRAVDVSGPVTLSDDLVWSNYLVQFLRATRATGAVEIPEPLLRRLLPTACMTVDITVAELYDQTPGPGAGRPLTDDDQPS
jgi:pyridoxamine 5'-phosphate oxidase-like protein